MPSAVQDASHARSQSRTKEAATALELWGRRVGLSADQPAFRFKREGAWATLTWAEMDAWSDELAAGLRSLGVTPGDRICFLSQTRVEWMACDVAALKADAVSVPIYPSNTSEQCAFILNDAGASVVVVEDAFQLEKVLAIRERIPGVRLFVHIGGDAALEKADSRGRSVIRLMDVLPLAGASAIRSLDAVRDVGRTQLATSPEAKEQMRGKGVDSDSTFTIIYTSGTTGNPKGVVLSHRNLTSAIASACRSMTLLDTDDQLLFLPLAHVLGRELAWVSVQAGLLTTFAESIAKLKENLMEVSPTYMAGVPRVFEKFFTGVQSALSQGSSTKRALVRWALRVGRRASEAAQAGRAVGPLLALQLWLANRLVYSKLRGRLGLSRCRFLVSGGAPLAAEIGQFFDSVGIRILEGYGLTETMAAAFLNRLEEFRFGTVGPALDVVESKIADDGEILMRGRSMFRSYYKNPEATAEAIDAEGWFHSGDIGHFEGPFLRITDRKKDLIVTAGGKKVAPQPLENEIKIHVGLVSQAVVYGDKRPYCVALLTPSEEAFRQFGKDHAIDVAGPVRKAIELQLAELNRKLASYETIKAFALLPREFTEADGEMTPSLKVKRKLVIEKYRAIIDGLYAGGHSDS